MNVFLVGGAVRDELLGLAVSDRDYVVVGSTPERMLAEGFRQVGSDFPVFLHPESGDEYALARTERKSGKGYAGFEVHAAPDVTLEADLARRDLTINAMARSDCGQVTDPYGGMADLGDKVLRHVRAASFIEDPVRVLRLARFAARYAEFTVAPETLELCRGMVRAGELDHLVAERVWQEISRGLMEGAPARMFEFLRACGALAVLMPELDRLWGVPQPASSHPELDTGAHILLVLSQAALQRTGLDVRFACLMHDLGKGVTPPEGWPAHHRHDELGVALVEALCARLKVPAHYRELAVLTCREHTLVHRVMTMTPAKVVSLLERVDAFRRPERLICLMSACLCDARGRAGLETRHYPQMGYLGSARDAAASVNAGAVAAACDKPQFIRERIHAARVAAVKAAKLG